MTEHKLLTGPIFPFDVRTDFVKVTSSTVLVPITLQIKNRDITFVTRDNVSKGVVNILGKVTTLTHKTVQTFEDTVEVQQPSELLQQSLDRKSIYWKAIPLQPGLYRLDIAIKDVANPDHMGYYGSESECTDLSRREAGYVVADSCRQYVCGQFARYRCRQLCDRQHPYLPARNAESSHTGEFQAQSAAQLLDAGI